MGCSFCPLQRLACSTEEADKDMQSLWLQWTFTFPSGS